MKNKRLLAILLFILMLVTATVCLSACKKNKKFVAQGEEGSYYCDVAGGELTVTLKSGEFTLTLGSEEKTGTYSYVKDTKVLTLTYSDKSTEAATLDVDAKVMNLKYNGTDCTLVEKVAYTVKYMDGTREIGKEEILNGRKIAQPADPEKEGYRFIGWYADAELQNKYTFGAKITGNVNVYARFVEDSDSEFTVAFVNGTEKVSETRTINGVVEELATLTETGKTFLGWWISDFDSAEKLTRKFNAGETIAEDITLYAVWESDQPAVSVTSDGVRWNALSATASYTVVISDSEGSQLYNRSVGTTSVDFDFSELACGEYVVSVTYNDNTTTVYYNNKALSRVSLFEVQDYVLTFKGVANATRYSIKVVCGDDAHEHTAVALGDSLRYDFSNCEMRKGGIVFVVTAMADGYASSVSRAFTFEQNLGEIEIVRNELTETVTWDEVENAEYYTVTVNDKVFLTTDKFFFVGGYTGEVVVKVEACAWGYNSSAAEITYTNAKLSAPVVTLNGTTVTWDAVDGAVGYIVETDGKLQEVTETTFALTAAVSEVKVTAKASNASNNSVATVLTVANEITNLKYSHNVVTWDAVYGASKYVVKVNDGEETEVTDNFAKIALTKAGDNVITVSYVKAEQAEGAKTITVKAYTVSFETGEGNDEVESVYVAVGDAYELPAATSGGYEFVGWTNAAENGRPYVNGILTEGKDLTMYATWEAKSFIITIDLSDLGVLPDGVQLTHKVYYGEKFTLPTIECSDTTKAFGGWTSEANGAGLQYTDAYGVSRFDYRETSDKTFYPKWIDVFTFTTLSNGTYSVKAGEGLQYISTVTIPAIYNEVSVSTIEAGAFSNRKNVKVFNIPNTITNIELGISGPYQSGSAFYGCTGITAINVYDAGATDPVYYSVNGALIYNNTVIGAKQLVAVPYAASGVYAIPDGVTEIAQYALRDSMLVEVTVPASVINVNSYAFWNSASLTKVEFLDSATEANGLTISENAFMACTALVDVTLPARLASIDVYSFNGCTALTGFKMASVGTNYSVKDGIIVNAAEDAIVLAPQGLAGEYRIAAGIYTIGEYAFYNCTKLTKVTIPEWVTEIKAYAFYYCTGMRALVFEGTKNSDDLTVREQAFNYCRYVSVLDLPANLVKAEVYSFGIGYATAYATVNVNIDRESVDIAENAFVQKNNGTGSVYYYVKVVNIGATAPEINVSSVFGSGLSEVNVDPQNIHYSSVNGALFDKAIETLMYYPATKEGAYVIPDTVKKIDNNAFYRRTLLTAITIPSSVEEIGERAFYECTSLRTVTFVTGGTAPLTIGQESFKGCTLLGSFVIPARTTVVGDLAFSGCYFTTVTFEAGGTVDLTIKFRAFYNCYYVTSIALPERTKVVENNAFESCTRLKTISVPASVEKFGGYITVDDVEVLDSAFSVFIACNALEQVNVAEGNKYFKSIGGLLFYKGLYEGWYGSSTVFHDHTDGNVKALVFVPISAKGILEVPATVGYVFPSAFAYNGNYASLSYTANDGGITKVTFAASNNCIGNKIYFGIKAFSYAAKITEIVLPTGLTDILANTFEYCGSLTTITIPNTVETIQANAFYYCSKLENVYFEEGGTEELTLVGGTAATKSIFYYCFKMKSITLPERTVSVGNYAMAYCAFEEIHLPASLKTIGNYAFASQYISMSTLKAVVFANGSALESIGNYAFSKNGVLESINLPSTVKTIGANAFEYCLSLKSLTLPSALTSIGNNAFLNCVSMESITLSEGITAISDNLFYGWNALKSVVVPASVTSIGVSAFADCTSLASVTFASGSQLKSIGDYAFKNTALTTFAFPEVVDGESNVVYITLGQKLFDGCTELKSVHLSKSVSSIDNVFVGCSAIGTITVAEGNTFFVFTANGSMLTSPTGDGVRYIFDAGIDANGVMTIPEGVTHISAGAFFGNKNVKKIVLPESLREIGDYAFFGCTNLKEVVFSNSSASLEIGQYVFAQTGLDSIVIPTGVVGIGDYAFSGSAIKNIEFKGALTNVGKYMFNDCNNLIGVVFPELFGEISEGMFYGCTSLQTITIPNGVSEIATYAFYGSGIKTINWPQAGLTKIGNYAFAASALESITLGTSVTTLGNYVFGDCLSLTKVVLGNSVTTIGTYLFDGCTALTDVTLPSNSTYKTLSSYMFNGCTALAGLTIPSTVTTIGAYAFADAYMTKVQVPSTVTTVATNAFRTSKIKEIEFLGEKCTFQSSFTFRDCTELVKITLPSKMTAMSTSMFYGCTALENVDLPDTITALKGSSFYNCTALKTVHLPAKMTNMNASNGFSGCTSLTKVVIPGKITSIGANLFRGCTALEEVIFEENTGLKQLNKSTFTGCTALKYVDLRPLANLNNLGDAKTVLTTTSVSTFYGCSSIEEVWLPAGITFIPYSVFFQCSSLKTLHTEGVITQIGGAAFSSCTSLESFPEDCATLTNIQASGFFNCSSLKKVVLTSKLTTLAKSAFSGCAGLEEVEIEEGVGNLTVDSIFKDCSGLKKVTLPKLTTVIPVSTFEGCTSLTEINIPENLISIGSKAFAYTNLGRVEIPASLEALGEGAFAGCPNIELVMPANSSFMVGPSGEIYDGAMNLVLVPANLVGEFTVPDGCTIARYAFAGCSKLTKINLPDSMTEIPAYAFTGIACAPEIVGQNLTGIGDYAFYEAQFTSFTIPAWVETIGKNAFQYSMIEKLTIPSNVKEIGSLAFSICQNLVEVTFEDGLEALGGDTLATGSIFYLDQALTKVTLPKTLKSIGYRAFYFCIALTHIDLPESLTRIEQQAFEFAGLESVYIPKNVTYLGTYAFGFVTTLKSVEFAEGIEAIGYENQTVLGGYSGNVFYGCSALVDVKLPKTLRYIGEQFFGQCTALEKIELPDGLISIGSKAFMLCTGIKQIVIPKSVRIIGTTVFSGWTEDQKVCFEHTVAQAMFFSDIVVDVKATVVYGYVKPVQ